MLTLLKVFGAVVLTGLLANVSTRLVPPQPSDPYTITFLLRSALIVAGIVVAWAVFFWRPFKSSGPKR